MIWMTVVFLSVVELYACIRYRDLKCPAVLHNVFWIISLIGAQSLNMEFVMNFWAMVIIAVGALIFQFGFAISQRVSLGVRIHDGSCGWTVNARMVKMLVIIVVLASLPSFYQYYMYMRGSFGMIYSMLSSADETLSLPVYFSHYRKIVEYLSLAFLTLYWMADKVDKKRICKWVITLFVVAVLFVATVPTRNGVLFYALPLLILFICTHDLSNRTVVLLGIAAVIGFMGVYYGISLGKYWYLYESASTPLDVLTKEVKTYLSGGIIAFGNTFQDHAYMYGGMNTFRFFVAVGDALFGTSLAVKLVNEFTSTAGLSTNVYTFYDFYLRDFGVMYALFAQFVIACIHGANYKGVMRGNRFQVYMFSLLSYPLVMQFFQDQYCSLLSTWLQIIIVGAIVLESGLFIRTAQVYVE